MDIQQDFRELLALLNAAGVEYLIVGGPRLETQNALERWPIVERTLRSEVYLQGLTLKEAAKPRRLTYRQARRKTHRAKLRWGDETSSFDSLQAFIGSSERVGQAHGCIPDRASFEEIP